MGSSKKNQKKSQASNSSVTLHNFFNSGVGTSKESKPQRSPKAEGKQRAVPPPVNLRTEDIIVIDSSDDEIQVVSVIESSTKKRRRMSASSGEVEFVSASPLKRPTVERTTASRVANKHTSTELDSPPNQSLPVPTTTTSHMFGEPSSLLRSAPPITPFLPIETTSVASSSFGAPTSILRDSLISPSVSSSSTIPSGQPETLLGPCNESAYSSSSFEDDKVEVPSIPQRPPLATVGQSCGSIDDTKMDVDIDVTLEADDDWRTGDDETGMLAFPDNDDFESLEDLSIIETESGESKGNCPMCGQSFSSLTYSKMQSHLDECLDSGHNPGDTSSVYANGPTTNAQSVNLRPLSTIVPPKAQGNVEFISCDGKTKASNSNAFSVLMSSHKENEAWKEATQAEDRNFRPTKANGGRRKAPFYKVLQGMPIAVDAFRYGTIPGVTAYFLTHAHSDHYTNLSSNWTSGPIYCSEGTANLIIHMLAVDPKYVHPLALDMPTLVPNTNGVHVTLIEANHCPGSCLFFFEGPQTVNAGDSVYKSHFVGSSKTFRYLHCGDFRASPQHVLHPSVKGKKIDHVYLDTTYLDPKYTFPPQPLVISACAELAKRIATGQSVNDNKTTVDAWMTSPKSNGKEKAKEERTLFVVGTYSIGKERVVKAIAHSLNTKVYCDARKAAILRCQADADLNALLTSDPLDANVHLVPLGMITSDKLKVYVERYNNNYTKAVGFRPTGWTFTQPAGTEQMPTISTILSRTSQRSFTYANLRPARNSTPTLQLIPVPYSEHSSFYELTCFAMSFNWGKMIATVNVGSESSRGKMARWVARWEDERKRQGKVAVVPYRQPDYW